MAFAFPPPPALQKSIDASKVEYVKLGGTGLRVSYPILGAMAMGSSKFDTWIQDEEESLAVLKAAWEIGLNTWDTANVYSNGKSEEIVGKALKEFNIPREKVVLMTKCWGFVGTDMSINPFAFGPVMEQTVDYVNQGGLSRTAIFNAVEASLARLGTTYIDILQIHRLDPSTPIEETMKALHDLVQSGKVRYIGASSMFAYQFARLQHLAETKGWTKFVNMQNLYNLAYREEEREMNKFCNETGVGLTPWSPMHGGSLARPLDTGDSIRAKTPHPMKPELTEADKEVIKRIEKVAADKGWTMPEVSLTWLRSKGATPIVGFNSPKRVQEAAGLKGKELTEEEKKFLEEPYVPKNIMGHF